MYEITDGLSISDKLEILADAAKYDVACTSSGVDRRGKEGYLGNSCAAGVCHSFAADGRCISLLKILMTNHCMYDCKYCHNRKSNDVRRATFTPREICDLTIEFYKRNYIEGLFLSSGVINNPEYTMEKMCETLRLLRTEYKFNGYIHVKAIPGAPQELIYSAGLLADRISINMELPTEDSLSRLAPQKTFNTIFKNMGQITNTIAAHRQAIGKDARMERAGINSHLDNSIFSADSLRIEEKERVFQYPADAKDKALKRRFASAGQSTQMIIGASGETDYELVKTTQFLYQNFDLKRVFFSGYVPINDDSNLPAIGTPVPLLREHRLYQADWLLRYYGFRADELLSTNNPNFDEKIDPKCFWAITHLENFPVEVNRASYDELLRVPGIGPNGVKKIMSARRYTKITFPILKKMGIVLKRARYFITCEGKMMENIPLDGAFIRGELAGIERKDNFNIENPSGYHQMSLFTDFNMQKQV